MKVEFLGNIDEFTTGINLLAEDYGFEISPGDVKIKMLNTDRICVSKSGSNATIEYSSKAEFFRMFGYLLQNQDKDFEIREERFFDTCGAMIDLSHGALLALDTIKSIIRKMALMGHNMLMLYFEESYTVPEYPYFGHMRGRYTKDELREIDKYADTFGIEIIPAIQTLGHLSNTLRWKCFSNIKDTDDCLLVGEPETMTFVESCIKNITDCFMSDRLHIGFDETMSLGTGAYMVKYGHRPRIDIYLEHLKSVSEICEKYGKKPLIWNDMFFRLKGSTSGYAVENTEVPKEIAEQIPDNVELVGWDYSETDAVASENLLKASMDMGRNLWYAGAVHDWQGFCVHYNITIESTNVVLTSAKKLGLKNVFATTWGDDTPERDYMTVLLGFQLYAEHMYNRTVDMDTVMDRFSFCAKVPAQLILDISEIDEPIKFTGSAVGGPKILDTAENVSNPAKYLMWQDPLAGLFDSELDKLDYPEHFKLCMDKISSYDTNSEYKPMVDFYVSLCDILIRKTSISVRLRDAYKSNDKSTLQLICNNDIPELIAAIDKLWNANRKLWFIRHKAFGWDVLERRYGCLLLRLKTTIYRIENFINGSIDTIEELDEPRLPVIDKNEPIFFNDYLHTSTAWGR